MVLTDQPGEKSLAYRWSFLILVYKDQKDSSKAQAMLKFFDWCFKIGADLAIDLHYVPLPAKVYTVVHALWKKR